MTTTEQPGVVYDLREITGTGAIEDTFRLRYEVWSGEAELLPEVRQKGNITDEHDCHARHWAVFLNERMVASARLCVHTTQEQAPEAFETLILPSPIATISRLVVHKSARKRGLARQLDILRVTAARQENAKCVLVSAGRSRIEGLQSLGFQLTPLVHTASYCASIRFHGMVLIL